MRMIPSGVVLPPHVVIHVSTTTPLHSLTLGPVVYREDPTASVGWKASQMRNAWTTIDASASLSALSPDGLRYEQMGEAAGWRGRVVRAFFWCLRAWPPS